MLTVLGLEGVPGYALNTCLYAELTTFVILLQGCPAAPPSHPTPDSTCWLQELLGVAFLALVWLPSPPEEPWGSSWSHLPHPFGELPTPAVVSHTSPAHSLPCPLQGGRGSGLAEEAPRQLLCHQFRGSFPGEGTLHYAWLPINRNLSAPAAGLS